MFTFSPTTHNNLLLILQTDNLSHLRENEDSSFSVISCSYYLKLTVSDDISVSIHIAMFRGSVLCLYVLFQTVLSIVIN